MDILQAAAQSAPQLGAMAGLIWLVALLLRRESATEVRHTSELKRTTEQYRSDMADLREKLRELNRELEQERKERIRIENELYDLQRKRP